MIRRTCQQISEIRSQAFDGRVRMVQRLQMWVHERMCTCPVCRGFNEQLASIRDCVRETFVTLETREDVRLDEPARERMRAAMTAERTRPKDPPTA